MAEDYRWVLHLIDRLYGAATDDDLWPAALTDITRILDGQSSTLLFADTRLRPIDRLFTDNVSPETIASYQDHFHSIDIRMQRAIPGSIGSIVTDRDLVDEDVVENHAFYQEFLRPAGYRFVTGAVMSLDEGGYAFCSSHRGLKQEHADSDVLDRAGLIMPHLFRSLQLRRRLSAVTARGQAAFDLLDGLGQAVFLIDGDGRTVWQNAWADRLLDQQDGLITSEGELRTLSTSDNAELQRLIKSALAASTRPRVRPGGMMMVPRPSLKRSYQVMVTPLPRSPEMNMAAQQLNVSPSAAIFIMDLEQKSVPKAEVLQTLYKLTPAEARLATALGAGMSVKAYAERGKLSIHYVRWLLKQVEAKTDTRRMTDLIRLLARQTGFFGALAENDKANEENAGRLEREFRKKK